MFHPSDDSVVLIDELSSTSESVMVRPGSVEELLSKVKLVLSENLVEQTAACFQFHICSENGQQQQYYLDLSQGNIKEGRKKSGTLVCKIHRTIVSTSLAAMMLSL